MSRSIVVKKTTDLTLDQCDQAARIVADGLFQSNPWARYANDYDVEPFFQTMRHAMGVRARRGDLYCAFSVSRSEGDDPEVEEMAGVMAVILPGPEKEVSTDALPPKFERRSVPARTQYNISTLAPSIKALEAVAWPSGMAENALHLSILAVALQHQGRGVAGALLRRLCAEADEQGLNIMLACQEQRLVSMYRKYGMRLTPNAYHNIPMPEDAHVRSLPFYAMYRPVGGAPPSTPAISVRKITDPSPELVDRAAHITAEALFEANPIVRYSSDYKVELHYNEEPYRIAVRSRKEEVYYAFVRSLKGAAAQEELAGVLCVFPAGPRKDVNMDNLPPQATDPDPKPARMAYFEEKLAGQLSGHTSQAFGPDTEKKSMHVVSLCVDQRYQGMGVGGALMRQLCRVADRQGVGIVLSCQEEKNVGMYQKYGFEIPPGGYAEIPLPPDAEVKHIPIWAMIRRPTASSSASLPVEVRKVTDPSEEELEAAARITSSALFKSNDLVRYCFAYRSEAMIPDERHRMKAQAASGGLYLAFQRAADGTAGRMLGVLLCRLPGVERSAERESDVSEPEWTSIVAESHAKVQPIRQAFRAAAFKPDQSRLAMHLSSFGVAPEAQGKGVGGALIRTALADADKLHVECTLSTQEQVNVSIYERFGFRVQYHETSPLPEGAEVTSFRNWAMVRPAQAAT